MNIWVDLKWDLNCGYIIIWAQAIQVQSKAQTNCSNHSTNRDSAINASIEQLKCQNTCRPCSRLLGRRANLFLAFAHNKLEVKLTVIQHGQRQMTNGERLAGENVQRACCGQIFHQEWGTAETRGKRRERTIHQEDTEQASKWCIKTDFLN